MGQACPGLVTIFFSFCRCRQIKSNQIKFTHLTGKRTNLDHVEVLAMSLWFALLILQGSQAALGLVTSAVVPMSNAALAQQSVIRCRVPATCCYLRPYSRASRPAPTPGAAWQNPAAPARRQRAAAWATSLLAAPTRVARGPAVGRAGQRTAGQVPRRARYTVYCYSPQASSRGRANGTPLALQHSELRELI